MVRGIEIFRDHFAGNEDQYVIIGGAACDLLFGEAGLPFRATKDIDMVLCVEVVDAAFGEKFKAFLEAADTRRVNAAAERRNSTDFTSRPTQIFRT